MVTTVDQRSETSSNYAEDVNENGFNLDEQQTLQLLTFSLDFEVFGAEISQIQEVLEYTKISRIPRMPAYMLGVINLRGNVVPVIDLRKRFDMAEAQVTVDTCIVIVEVELDGERTSLGLLADAVKEVMVLPKKEISNPPKVGASIDSRFIYGIGKASNEFIIILDLPKVFSQELVKEYATASEGKV